jgi:hypothetical protein
MLSETNPQLAHRHILAAPVFDVEPMRRESCVEMDKSDP